MKKKILIIDEVFGNLNRGLIDLGFDVNYQPDISRSELISKINDYDGLVVRMKTEIDKEILIHASKLKFIARAGVGLDNIDTKYCDEKKIICLNSGEANSNAVGEQTVGMLLSLLAKIVKADKEVRQSIWNREANRGVELTGKTVGIIGYGNTGKAVAKKLSGFEVNVIAYDKYLENFSDQYVKQVSMNEIFEETDIISFHIPLTEETLEMVNLKYLNSFKKNISLLNLSRGKVVKTQDLVTLMKSGKIIGCCLDVLENEKLENLNDEEKKVFEYLIHSDISVLTPHVGGWTKESFRKISDVLLLKIKDLKY